jgi:hypothetical protein
MPTELTYTYTTREEIQRLYGSSGQQAIIQDLSGSNISSWYTELIADASDIINQYCLVYYHAEDLGNSRWVHTRATWIAAYLLSQRRGNPALWGGRYAEILEELRMVLAGLIQIPGLPTRSDFTPAMSNLVIDDHFQISKIRVQPFISTGGVGSNQQIAYRWPFDYL